MAVYLLHSTTPLRRTSGVEVRHYVGFARDGNVEARVRLHRTARCRVPILRAYKRAGGKLLLVRIWATGTRTDERRVKTAGHLAELCPLCSPDRVAAGDIGAWRLARSKE